jgi:two-component system sensor histidine kinase MprB
LLSRFVLAAGIAVAVGIGVVVVVAYVAVRHQLVGQVDGQLRRQATDISRAQNSGHRPPRFHQSAPRFGVPGNYLQILDSTGRLQHPTDQTTTLPVTALDRSVAKTGRGSEFRDITLAGNPVRLMTAPLPGKRAVQVALPLSDVDKQLHRLAFIFAGVGLAGLVVAGGLAALLGRRTLTPVARLTAAAEQVAATRDLAHRIVEERTDELGRLSISFNTMLGALQKSQSAQRQLVADASHEMRTPLASLRTNVEVLHRLAELEPADRDAALHSIVTQLDELASLVGDVVELARGDEPAPEFVDVRLDQLVSHAVDRARRHWPAVTFADSQAPVLVRGIPARLDRAIANLLDNAAKFSPAGSTVAVELGLDGTLTVTDHGPGIAPSDLPSVFDRFFRAADARGLPGSGLGLAIVKQVADVHGAAVGLRNVPDGGTCATLAITPVDLGSDSAEFLHLTFRNTP